MSSAGPAPAGNDMGRRRGEAADPFRLLADFAPVMIWVASPDRKRVYVNRPWLDFTGREFDAELGLGWTDNVHPDDREALLETHARAFEAQEPIECEFRLRRHDGDYRWLIDKGVALLEGGKLRGYAGSCLDITERAHARAEQLALVSHELRTPLNGIKTWTHVLETQLRDADPAVRRAIDGILIGVEQQARLIEDLLDVARCGDSPFTCR